MKSASIASAPDPQDALSWLQQAPEGALAFVVTSAKGMGVRVAPRPEAPALLDAALDRALAAGASRALLWQAEGDVAVGAPVAIAGACAEHRKDALRALDVLLAGLKGVAERTDLPGTPANLSPP